MVPHQADQAIAAVEVLWKGASGLNEKKSFGDRMLGTHGDSGICSSGQ
jgi:hypothetical protein